MALGANAKMGCKPKIVTIGLNYYQVKILESIFFLQKNGYNKTFNLRLMSLEAK